jgi:hypothetical protein
VRPDGVEPSSPNDARACPVLYRLSYSRKTQTAHEQNGSQADRCRDVGGPRGLTVNGRSCAWREPIHLARGCQASFGHFDVTEQQAESALPVTLQVDRSPLNGPRALFWVWGRG